MNKKLTVIALSLSFFLSCQLDIPVKEMSDARIAIKKAEQFKAAKYAPELLKLSIDTLYKSHDDLKKEDAKSAKKNAVASLKAANDAIDKSLPLLSADTIAEARSVQKESENLNAEKYAPEEYSKALSSIADAEKLYADKSFEKSYYKAIAAKSDAEAARAKALAAIPALIEKIANLESELKKLSENKRASVAADDLKNASTSLEKSNESVKIKMLKTAAENIKSAEDSIALAKIKIYKGDLAERIAISKTEVERLNASRGKDFAAEDLASASASLSEAETLLGSSRFDESAKKISDAEKSIASAAEKIKKGAAADKIASAEKLFESTKAKDPDNKYTASFDIASGFIAEAKKNFDTSSYDESMKKSDDAEAALNAIVMEMGQTTEKITTADPEKRGTVSYTVKYDPKNRDCLWRISLKVYKDAKLWPLIYMANKDQIKNPDLIFPGQKFIIPPVPEKKKSEDLQQGDESGNDSDGEKKETSPEKKDDKPDDSKGESSENRADKDSKIDPLKTDEVK